MTINGGTVEDVAMKSNDPDRDMLALGLAAKTKGNELFKVGTKYKQAITSYTEAIDEFEDYMDGEKFEAAKEL